MKKIFNKENLKRFFRSYIWLMLILFVIDIATKWAVVNHYGVAMMNVSVHHENTNVITIIKNFCYIGGAINNKAAFSLGPSRGILLTISIVMSGGLIAFYVIKYKKLREVEKISVALMIAGAVGNLIDRAFYWPSTTGFDGVVDWIIFVFWGHEFAMFNIADASLVVGVVILIVQMFIDEIKEAIAKGKKGEYKKSPKELKAENEANKNK